MYSPAVVLSALRNYDLFERVSSAVKFDWFKEKHQKIAEAIRACHADQSGRVLTWKEIKLKNKQLGSVVSFKDVIKRSKDVSKVALHKQLSEFMEVCLIEDIIVEMAEEKEHGKPLKHEQLIQKIESAQKIAHMHAEFVNYFDNDLGNRIKDVDHIPVVGFPSLELTEAFDGGAAGGQLITILAKTDGGKTMFLINCGRHSLQKGLTVLHCTHETTKLEVLRRYDCSLTKHSWDWIKTHPKSTRKEIVKAKKAGGNLIIEDFSASEASVVEIRIAADRVKRDFGRLDLIIVDYGDLVRSSRQYDSKRDEHRLVWQELRRLGKRFNCPVFTATQSNRMGAAGKVVDLTHIGESWAKATDSDAVIILHAPPEERRALAIVAKTKRKGHYPKIPMVFLREKCYIK